MKWVLIVVGVLAGLVALAFVVGMLLPRDHVARGQIDLTQPPDSIWPVLRDFGAIPSWWKDVKTSRRYQPAEGREGWEQEASGFTMRLIIADEEPPRRLVTRIDAPADAAFGGTWTYELAPSADGRGTTVAVTEHGYVNNALFRVMSRFLFGYHATVNGYLRALGKRFGQDVQPRNL